MAELHDKPIWDSADCISNPDAPIHTLPIEILEYVFTFLSVKQRVRIELVCRHWRCVNKLFPWSWPRALTLKSKSANSRSGSECDNYQVTDDVVSSILCRCGLGLKRLTLERTKFGLWTASSALQCVTQYCANLEQLTLLNVPLDVEQVQTIGQSCVKLKALRLHRYDEVCEVSLTALVRGCKDLELLEVCASTNDITGDCFAVIGPKLKVLRLFSFKRRVAPMRFDHLVARCDGLQELNLRLNDGLYKVDQKSLLQVLMHFKNTLTTVGLESTPWCSTVHSLQNLEKVNLTGCRHVNAQFCRRLLENCVKIRVLDVSGTDVMDEGLSFLASLPMLVVLDVSYTNVTGSGIEVLGKQGRLKVFIAKDLYHVMSGDWYFRSFPKFCRNLRILDVCNTPTISNNLVKSFCAAIQDGVFNKRITLNVTGTAVTTDVQTCPLLTVNFGIDDEEDISNDDDEINALFRIYDPKDVL